MEGALANVPHSQHVSADGGPGMSHTLIIGLLISNANTSFTRVGGEVTMLPAQLLRLDHILRRYGADAEAARSSLLQ